MCVNSSEENLQPFKGKMEGFVAAGKVFHSIPHIVDYISSCCFVFIKGLILFSSQPLSEANLTVEQAKEVKGGLLAFMGSSLTGHRRFTFTLHFYKHWYYTLHKTKSCSNQTVPK